MEKAIIIIAVSECKGMEPLPGAIVSALRVGQWATRQNYKRLFLTDRNSLFEPSDINNPITVDRPVDVNWCKKSINKFLGHPVDRLIVYFAGHGMTMAPASQIWLLSGAADSDEEGIKVDAFRRGLERYNLASSNPDMRKGQVCIIADCCRNIVPLSGDFEGHKILTKRGSSSSFHLDQFNATIRGKKAFQANPTGSREPFCIFSDVLLGALEGEAPEAVDTVLHPNPSVTSQTLEDYLLDEVPKLSEQYGEIMEPDVNGTFHHPNNVYATLDSMPQIAHSSYMNSSNASIGGDNQHVTNMGIEQVGSTTSNTVYGEHFELMSANFEQLLDSIEHTDIEWRRNRTSWISDLSPEKIRVRPESICRVRSLNRVDNRENTLFCSVSCDLLDLPVFIFLKNSWMMVPGIPNRLSYCYKGLLGDIALYHTRKQTWDLTLSDYFSNKTGSALRLRQATSLADRVRQGKSEDPHMAVLAGYLYEGTGDRENIARTSHYMVEDGYNGANGFQKPFLPIDLALLCADSAWWVEDSDGIPRIHIDLPSVPELDNENSAARPHRPYFTTRGFDAVGDVQAIGVIPTYRAGWEFIETADYLDVSEDLLKLKKHLIGRSITHFTDEGMELFSEMFGYVRKNMIA